MQDERTTCTAFDGERCVASGSPLEVALALKRQGREENVLVFDDASGRQVDFDLSGTPEEIAARIVSPSPARAPGRPKLGVVAREVTLLPRHWDWLNRQPGGASAALRKLVDAARAASGERDRARQAQTAADRFMMAMAGNLPGYEAAARALYAGDADTFHARIADWPPDVKAHADRLARPAFAE